MSAAETGWGNQLQKAKLPCMQLRCAGDWRLLYTKHSGGSDPVRSQAGKGPLLSTVAHHFHSRVQDTWLPYHYGSRLPGVRRCCSTEIHGSKWAQGGRQLLARWLSLGPGKPCGHTHLSNGLCVVCDHKEARDQFNWSPSHSYKRNLQPTWGVRSPCPKAQRQ